MAIITLTTDWKSNDFYLGAVKGVILSYMADANIVDLNHQIPTFNTSHASFVLKNSFHYFPKGTVHIVDVNSEASKNIHHIAISYQDHFFIGTDNGGLSLIFDTPPEKIVQLDSFENDGCKTFPAISVFAQAAAHLAMQKPIEELGTIIKELNTLSQLNPTIDEAIISGTVVFVDSFYNVITNISRELFDRIGRGRSFEIIAQSNRYRIKKINQTYNETLSGELLAIFNSANLLELAINKGNIVELLGLGLNSTIRIKFSEI